MAKYLIHAMPKRMWYVEQYLIPSMIEQGIAKEDIQVYNDVEKEGNLKAWLKSIDLCPNDSGGTWHLQDDVCIGSRFKELTEKHDNFIVCGFKSEYDGPTPAGEVPIQKMWFSFPCIRIPNKILHEAKKWIEEGIIGNPVYTSWWKRGVNDDLLFRRYVWEQYPATYVLNLDPNIVDHIDYLIGGTVNSNARGLKQIRAIYWEDKDITDELERILS